MGIEADIFTGAFTRLSNASIGATVWPNVPYSGSLPYLRVHILQANTQALGLNTGDIRKGIIQVDCVIKDGIGPMSAAALADLVLAAFPRNSSTVTGTTTIKFNQTGSVGPGQQESDRYFIPVSIPYEVIA